MSKKLINSPERAVDESLYGLVRVHPGLTLLADHRVVVRSDIDVGKVKKWEGSVYLIIHIIVAIFPGWHYLTYCRQ